MNTPARNLVALLCLPTLIGCFERPEESGFDDEALPGLDDAETGGQEPGEAEDDQEDDDSDGLGDDDATTGVEEPGDESRDEEGSEGGEEGDEEGDDQSGETGNPEPVYFCGNGVLEPGEDCDDGNVYDDDGCLSTCVPNVCGDGFVDLAVEQCEPGLDDAPCTEDCLLNVCGDGYVMGEELCDPASVDDDGSCTPDCTPNVCGDGHVMGSEACDPGDTTDGPCTAECVPNVCGDGHLDASAEACDDGNGEDFDGCAADCSDEVCGYTISFTAEDVACPTGVIDLCVPAAYDSWVQAACDACAGEPCTAQPAINGGLQWTSDTMSLYFVQVPYLCAWGWSGGTQFEEGDIHGGWCSLPGSVSFGGW